MRTISPNAKEKFISTAMRLQMQGRKEVAYRLILKGLDDLFIAEATGLTEKEVENLRTLKDFKLD